MNHWARSIQPKFPEILVQNTMDLFGPTVKVSKKHLLRWTTFPGGTGWNFGEWIAPIIFMAWTPPFHIFRPGPHRGGEGGGQWDTNIPAFVLIRYQYS